MSLQSIKVGWILSVPGASLLQPHVFMCHSINAVNHFELLLLFRQNKSYDYLQVKSQSVIFMDFLWIIITNYLKLYRFSRSLKFSSFLKKKKQLHHLKTHSLVKCDLDSVWIYIC